LDRQAEFRIGGQTGQRVQQTGEDKRFHGHSRFLCSVTIIVLIKICNNFLKWEGSAIEGARPAIRAQACLAPARRIEAIRSIRIS
ncbi:MAG: hypothetical protein J0I63_16875, partial [Thiobacillus sp.]|nr:hypothetical protein [Thiobacillus sp.]